MGWNVSHGSNQYGEMRRSYTTVTNIGRQVSYVLSATEWRSIAYLFNRPTADPFTVQPSEAGRIAAILYGAAVHRLMPADWADDVDKLADAANCAASKSEPWEWR